MKNLIIFGFLFFPFALKSQITPTNYPYQTIFIGLDSYIGYDKIGDAFKWKYEGSTSAYMRNLLIPSLGFSHRFNRKTTLFVKAGYGFAQSDDFDTIVGTENLLCERKIRSFKFDIEANYLLFHKNSFGIALSGEVGYNMITEKLSSVEDYKYNKIGFGGGLIFYYNEYPFSLKYYKIGDINLIGAGIKIPVWNNIND